MISYLKKLKFSDRITLAILAAIFLFGCYASMIEPFKLKVTRWDIGNEKWPYSGELKIALLADMHMIWPWMTSNHLQKIIDQTNELKPDIVLLLGDYVATHPFGLQLDPEKALAPLKSISAPCGIYAVLGNHDLHPPSRWPDTLTETGIPVLQNQALPINCNDLKFWIAGLEDLWWGNADIGKTLTQVRDDNPVIMMMHNPDSFPEIPQRVLLSVAGHTHGGQVRIPFWGAVSAVVPSKYGNRYVYGHIVEDGKDLVVSSGLGMTGLPIRFSNSPEISLITLR